MNKRQIISILKKYRLIIILVGLVLSYFLIVSPLVQKWKKINRQTKYLETKLIDALPYLEEEVKVNSLYNALTEMMNIKIEDKGVEEIKTEIYEMLNKAANRYNVVIKRYRPRIRKIRGSGRRRDSSRSRRRRRSSRYSGSKDRRTKTRGVQYSIIINLDLEARLYDFVRFAYYIENSPYLMQIRQANFTPLRGDKMRINIDIKKIVL